MACPRRPASSTSKKRPLAIVKGVNARMVRATLETSPSRRDSQGKDVKKQNREKKSTRTDKKNARAAEEKKTQRRKERKRKISQNRKDDEGY
jgi:hypothetical protein